MPMIHCRRQSPLPPGLRFTAVDVPPPAPDVVPLPPSPHPVPPQQPIDVPPEIQEPLLPGQGEPVRDPASPEARLPRRVGHVH